MHNQGDWIFSLYLVQTLGQDQYESAMIRPRSFDKMAEECGLAKPLVKKRILELSESVISVLDKIDINNSVAEGVKSVIKRHCLEVLRIFKE